MAIDPQVEAYLESTASLPPVQQLTPSEARANVERSAPVLAGPPIPVERVEDVDLGGVPGRIYVPAGAGAHPPALVWFHGGGWVVGSVNSHDGLCRRLAAAAGCAVIAVEYRLAPEHPYPSAILDAWTAMRWVAHRGADIGIDPKRLAVGGDSAGGNLAAVVALRARDIDMPVRLQVLIYPVLDSDLDTESYRANATGYGLTREAMAWYWEQYCPDPAQRAQPDASPLRAASLAGAPPALVVTCELDPLRSEGEAYARRLQAEGVGVTHEHYPGMIHGFARMFAVIDAGHRVVEQVAAAMRDTFGLAAPAGAKGVAGSAPAG